MGLKVTSLDQLDPALVEQLQVEFTQLMQEKFPEVEIVRGPNHDIVHFLSGGVSAAINQTEMARLVASQSLLAIRANPELADDEIVDAVMSNLLISRKVGTAATGEITIVVEGSTSVIIPARMVFAAGSVNFTVNEAITAKPPGGEILSPTDRILEDRGDGTFEFSVPATAAEIGDTGNVRRNTRMVPAQPPARFVTAFAGTDFTGGVATEDNENLLARADEGIPAKVMQGRKNIVALLKDQDIFTNTKHYSIIGCGNPEMSRDQNWIWPTAGGGRVDIYARTATLPLTTTLKKLCTLVEKQTVNQSIWQFALGRDDSPGFYEVAQVRRTDDPSDIAGFDILQDTRGYDFSDDDFHPDIVNAEQATYTRYQTAVIQFLDTSTNVSEMEVGDQVEYTVGVAGQPLIRELQDFANSGDHTNLMGDVLIKGCVPCVLSINFTILKNADETTPDVDPIKTAIADRINNMDFPGVVYASQIADIAHNYLTGSMALDDVSMFGHIRRIDGEVSPIRDTQALAIPDAPSTLVTANTTTFILYPERISISVQNRGR